MNQVILQGVISSDVTNRSTPTGKQVSNFSVMTSYSTGNGARNDYHRVTVWNPRTELKKGLNVFLTGSLQTRSWQDKKSGEKKYVTEVNAREIYEVTTPQHTDDPAPITKQENDFLKQPELESDVPW